MAQASTEIQGLQTAEQVAAQGRADAELLQSQVSSLGGVRRVDLLPIGELVDTAMEAALDGHQERPFMPRATGQRRTIDDLCADRKAEGSLPLWARMGYFYRKTVGRLLHDGEPGSVYSAVRDSYEFGDSSTRPFEYLLGRLFVERHASGESPSAALAMFKPEDMPDTDTPGTRALLFEPTLAGALRATYAAYRDRSDLVIVSHSDLLKGAVEAFKRISRQALDLEGGAKADGAVNVRSWSSKTSLKSIEDAGVTYDRVELANSNRVSRYDQFQIVRAAGSLIVPGGELVITGDTGPREIRDTVRHVVRFAEDTLGTHLELRETNAHQPDEYRTDRVVYRLPAAPSV